MAQKQQLTATLSARSRAETRPTRPKSLLQRARERYYAKNNPSGAREECLVAAGYRQNPSTNEHRAERQERALGREAATEIAAICLRRCK